MFLALFTKKVQVALPEHSEHVGSESIYGDRTILRLYKSKRLVFSQPFQWSLSLSERSLT